MKILILLTTLFFGLQAFACTCEETYKTPYADEIAIIALKKIGLEATFKDLTVIKYYPTFADRMSAKRPTSCSGTLAGEPIHLCTEQFTGIYEAVFSNLNCKATVKVWRKKTSYKYQILDNTCKF